METEPRTTDEPLEDFLATDRAVPSLGKRIALFTFGIVFIALGVIGWLIPVMTGIPFYVVGFVLIGMTSPRAAKWINGLERRLPRRLRVALRKVKRSRIAGGRPRRRK